VLLLRAAIGYLKKSKTTLMSAGAGTMPHKLASSECRYSRQAFAKAALDVGTVQNVSATFHGLRSESKRNQKKHYERAYFDVHLRPPPF
jgi:hypothetical protein